MDHALLQKYDRPVPRYTSYPTAPHFHAGIGPAEFKRWIAASDADRPVSLYLHVPYCRQMCWYCGCHTKIVARYQPIGDFAQRLAREITLASEAFGARRRLSQVHWGGGTPNVLNADDLKRLTDEIRRNFQVDDATEIAMELDPRWIDRDLLAALRDGGVARVSLGIQDFDPAVQSAINRIQPFDVVKEKVEALREIGIRGVNFDLIYGLPHQTRESFAHSIDQALALKPDRFAVFGYAHVPWMKRHQAKIEEAALPDAAARLTLAEDAAARIEAGGYRRIGLDHFAKAEDPLSLALDAGTLRRNFQGYTTDNADILIGLGPSAISALPAGYAQNAADIPLWGRAVDSGELAIQRGIALSPEDRWRRAAIERLMCFGALDLAALADEFKLPNAQFAGERARLAPLIADGIATLAGQQLRISPEHLALARLVAACFDAYLNAGPGRHSRAV
ncbi:MAG TPA: oxygen-independent coproporphyrinogen III oxidase [Candidatus Binatia bacterium]|nr:oxygen-independent coproporphyrinogen III oxidase [Candidatus Binatia bacterium]